MISLSYEYEPTICWFETVKAQFMGLTETDMGCGQVEESGEMAATTARRPAVQAEERKSRSGSETRKRSDQISLRLRPEQRRFLENEARKRGLNSAQELILLQLESVFTEAGLATAS